MFYVYAHYRVTDGSIFYIGKGTKRRAWEKSGRSELWGRIYSKHGRRVEVIQQFQKEDDAFLLEMWLIAKLRSQGVFLSNITEGGEGSQGFRWSYDRRLKKRDDMGGRKVHCSNGMQFDTLYLAVMWVSEFIGSQASAGNISKCCRGEIQTAYNFGWSYNEINYVNLNAKRDSNRRKYGKPVVMDGYLSFQNGGEASDYVRANTVFKKASPTHIMKAARGIFKTAYGHTWSMEK